MGSAMTSSSKEQRFFFTLEMAQAAQEKKCIAERIGLEVLGRE
jgi:hypothetical protein